MLCPSRFLSRAITFAILVSTAFADVVVLKSGEKVEGKVLQETDQQITVAVKVSASITDERIIPRAEIERIDKVSAETEIFKAVNVIQPGNNSLAPAQYDAPIRTLQAYIKQFPAGTHTAEVQNTLNEFLAEKKRVEAGEAKLRGQWLSKAEIEKERVQIGGALALEQMKAQSAAGDNIAALNTFNAVEKVYVGCMSMPEMVELARQLAAAIKPVVERAIPEQKILKARKEQGFANAGPGERPEMIASYKAEMAQAEAAVTAAVQANQWPPFVVTNEKCLTALASYAEKETTRLGNLPLERMKRSVELTATAKKAITTEDWETASASLKEATSLWPVNELAKRLSPDVTASLKASAVKNAPATPDPATPKPKSTPKPSAAIKAAATPVPQEEPTPFYMTVPGAIGIVVTIAAALVGVNVYKKMKARKENPEA